jgi:hypothetical protein
MKRFLKQRTYLSSNENVGVYMLYSDNLQNLLCAWMSFDWTQSQLKPENEFIRENNIVFLPLYHRSSIKNTSS